MCRRRTISILLLTGAMALLAPLSAQATSSTNTAHTPRTKVSDGKHHWFLPNHPRMRRIGKAMGFGLVTGSLAAPIMGGAVVGGAMAGAAEGGAVRGAKDSYDLKKHHKLDKSIF